MEQIKELFDKLKQQKIDEVIELIDKYMKNEDNDIDLNMRDSSNMYLIQYAIIFNNIKLVKKLIQYECRLDFIDTDGHTILYTCIRMGYNNIVKLLIEDTSLVGIPLTDIDDKKGEIPLHYAIQYDNNEAFDLLIINSTLINKLNVKGLAPLHLAIKKKNYYVIEKLLNLNNVNINIQTNIGETPLHIATNYEDTHIINKILQKSDLKINIVDYEHQISPLMYIVTLNNITLTKLLLENGADPHIQDALGNSSLHLAIIEYNVDIVNLLISKFNKFNLLNIESLTPFHLLVSTNKTDYNKIKLYNIDLLINNTNLNIQDVNGNTVWHLFAKSGLWYPLKNLLMNKKNNLFIKNNQNITPYDIVKDIKNFDILLDIIINSYYNMLDKSVDYINSWEKDCVDGTLNKNKCFIEIKKNILNKVSSVPVKKTSYCKLTIDNLDNNIMFTTFTGVALDVICGLFMVQKMNNNIMSTLNNMNLIDNEQITKYYTQMGIKKNNVDFMNFEIIWLYQNIFYPSGFENLINKFKHNDKMYFICPIGIELDNGAHANILLIDKENKTIERFEPNGHDTPPSFNYNGILMDNILSSYFKKLLNDYKYITPKDYLPKIGFQSYENIEYYKTRKLGDPGGFCAAWCLWYVFNRIKYNDIKNVDLVYNLIKIIKYNNMSFKNIIRNFSKQISDFRDSIINIYGLDINDYLNNQYSTNNLQYIQKYINQNI